MGRAKGLHQGWTGSQCLISGSNSGKWCLQTPEDQETWSWGVLVTEGLSSTGVSKAGGSRTAENPQLSCLRPSDHTQIPLLAEPNCMFKGRGAWEIQHKGTGDFF